MVALFKIFLSLLLLIPILGCWDRNEINDIAIVTGTGFDKVGEKNYRVAVQAPLPGEMGGSGSHGGGGGTSGGATFFLDAGFGKSVRDANEDVQKRMSRRLTFGHRRIAVFGEELARDGLRQTLDVITRTREARLTVQIFVVEGEALGVLAAKPHLENLSSEAVREIGVQNYQITLRDFLLDYQKRGFDPIMPVISIVPNVSPDKELQEDQIEIRKLAMFKDDKLEFITEDEQTAGASWLLGEKEGLSYTVTVEEDDEVNIRVIEHNVTINYEIENDEPVFSIDIDVTGNILENETELNLEEPESIERINKQIEEQIKREVTSILDETLEKGIDPFGFGWLLQRRERGKWQEWKPIWREKLPQIKYEVSIQSRIELIGLVTEGIGIGE